jgi:hypothetical protein
VLGHDLIGEIRDDGSTHYTCSSISGFHYILPADHKGVDLTLVPAFSEFLSLYLSHQLKIARREGKLVTRAITDPEFEVNGALAILRERDDRIALLRAAYDDAISALRYIRLHYGDLYGVGWARLDETYAKVYPDD